MDSNIARINEATAKALAQFQREMRGLRWKYSFSTASAQGTWTWKKGEYTVEITGWHGQESAGYGPCKMFSDVHASSRAPGMPFPLPGGYAVPLDAYPDQTNRSTGVVIAPKFVVGSLPNIVEKPRGVYRIDPAYADAYIDTQLPKIMAAARLLRDAYG